MNLKNTVLSLLDIFRLNKGQKIAEEPAVPLAPLIQRLKLPKMPAKIKGYGPDFYDGQEYERAQFVMDVVREKFPSGKISRRVLGKIARHYGTDLRHHGFFRAIQETRMLEIKIQLVKA